MLTLRTLSDIVPFALAGAISPALVAIITLYLASKNHPRRRAVACLLGLTLFLVLFGLVAHVVLRGLGAVHVRKDHRYLVGIGNLVIATALFLWAGVRVVRGPRPPRDETAVARRSVSTLAAFASGFGLMALNFTTLPLYVIMVREATGSGLALGSQVFILTVVTVIVMTPAWFPIAVTLVAPTLAQRVLGALNAFLARAGAPLFTLALVVLGVYLIVLGGPDVWNRFF